MSTNNICFYGEIMKIIPKSSPNTLICFTDKTKAFPCFGRLFVYFLEDAGDSQKEEFCEFDIYFLIENNYYQQMHYTKSVKTLWNTTCVFLFFTKQQVSIMAFIVAKNLRKRSFVKKKKKTYMLRNVGLLSYYIDLVVLEQFTK